MSRAVCVSEQTSKLRRNNVVEGVEGDSDCAYQVKEEEVSYSQSY